jgi:uncharacterized membrane protein YbhN (UPF0104 family)
VTLLVLFFVGRHTWRLVRDQDFSSLSICPGWLAVSALCYALGWLPSIWFWRHILIAHDQRPGWLLASKAYYSGHLGKYIPGKAGVLLLRAAILKEQGFQFGVSAITAAYETLVMMGVGLVVAGSLVPLLAPQSFLAEHLSWAIGWRWLPGAILIIAPLLAAPFVARLLSAISNRVAKTSDVHIGLGVRQLLQGYAVFVLSWIMLGLSLGAALQSLSDEWLSLSDLPLWTAAASSATVIGFLVVIVPGGIGVREGVMMEILRYQPEISAADAALVSWILRLVWVATEVGMFLVMAGVVRWSGRHGSD